MNGRLPSGKKIYTNTGCSKHIIIQGFSTSHNYVEKIYQKYGIADADFERNTNTLKYRACDVPLCE